MTDIATECIQKIAEAKQISPDTITLDTELESIPIDSLDRVSLAFDLEEQYGVEIPEAELHRIRTVRDITVAIEQALVRKTQDAAGATNA